MVLARILEPEVMDTADEARDYDAMDHAVVNQRFVEDLVAGGFSGGDVLDLGTGTAQIPIALCRHVDNCRVLAVDAAVEMLDLARLNIELAGLTERISLRHIDAKSLAFADRYFGTVMSNSIIHHIPEPLGVLSQAVRVTAAGGLLFFRDLIRPETDEQLAELVRLYADGANDHQQEMFAASLHAALSMDEIRSLVKQLGFDPATVQATSDRHWTWCAKKDEPTKGS